jgi:hypothetical protein
MEITSGLSQAEAVLARVVARYKAWLANEQPIPSTPEHLRRPRTRTRAGIQQPGDDPYAREAAQSQTSRLQRTRVLRHYASHHGPQREPQSRQGFDERREHGHFAWSDARKLKRQHLDSGRNDPHHPHAREESHEQPRGRREHNGDPQQRITQRWHPQEELAPLHSASQEPGEWGTRNKPVVQAGQNRPSQGEGNAALEQERGQEGHHGRPGGC